MALYGNRVKTNFRWKIGGFMTVRLIASDIDGTFLNDKHTFDHDRFQQQLNQIMDRDMKFVVASGNQLAHCQEVFSKIHGDITFVAEDGAVIAEQGKILDESPIPANMLNDLLDYLIGTPEYGGATLILSGRDHVLTNLTKESPEWDLTNYFYQNIVPNSDFKKINTPIYKVDIHWADMRDVRDKADKLRKDLGTELGSVMSGFSGIDITMPHVTKSYGLQQLQHIWSVSMDETMAFGDNQNDSAMLQHARLGYAMKNAAEEALEAAEFVTPLDNNQSGVMDVIDQVLDGRLK